MCRRTLLEGLGSPVALAGAAAQKGQLVVEGVPGEGPVRHPCPQPFQRARPRGPDPEAVLAVRPTYLPAPNYLGEPGL